MKKYLQIALMTLLVIAVSSCKDDNDEVFDETWKLENEAAFQAKATDPDYTQIKINGAGDGFVYGKKLKQGDGPAIYYNSRVTVYYKGWLINSKDGEYFDKREEEDGLPAKFAVSSSSANYSSYNNPNGYSAPITGWTIALQNMVVGDKWEVWIPYGLAYGTQDRKDSAGNITIPAYSTLIFEIEVMERTAEAAGTTDSQT